ncbi:hypothetical protein [Azohydromonas sediminis]|uniref:hypothetical protein n=1 Tax=Azohydromonas sediminis TaxID=2259674 RepID=UPI0013C32080|nr:hypothetical protein [Azohydromonas sediminis]
MSSHRFNEMHYLDNGSSFVSPSEFVHANCGSKLAARVGDLPVLCGHFDASRVDLSPGTPRSGGWQSLVLDGLPVLAFHAQVGRNVLYWFADASDPCVWSALDKWHAAGKMVLAASFARDRVWILKLEYQPGQQLDGLRHAAQRDGSSREKFARLMLRLAEGDALKALAATVVGSEGDVGHVQFCMVCTKETPRLYLHNVIALLPPQIAAAVTCTAMPVVRPASKAH